MSEPGEEAITLDNPVVELEEHFEKEGIEAQDQPEEFDGVVKTQSSPEKKKDKKQENSGKVEHVDYDDLKKALYIPLPFKFLEWFKLYLTPYIIYHTLFPWKHKDIRKVYKHQDAEYITSMFITDVKRRVKIGQKNAVFWTIMNQFGMQLMAIVVAFGLEAGSFLGTAILQEELLKWMVNPFESRNAGYKWVGYVFMVQVIGNMCRAFRTQYTLDLGVKLKMATSGAIYEKVMSLDSRDASKITSGQLIAFLGVDSKTLQTSALFVPWIAWSVVSFIGSISMTIKMVGWVAVLSIAVIIVIFPVQCCASMMFGVGVKQNLTVKDERIKKVNESVKGIQILKYFNWEKNSLKIIKKLRRREVFWLLTQFSGFVVTISTISMLPILFSIVIFSVYQIDNPLTPQLVFPTLTYLIQLNYSVAFLPMQVSFLASFGISLKRMENFLSLTDRTRSTTSSDLTHPIHVENGVFRWTVYQNEEDEKQKKKNKKKNKKKKKKEQKEKQKADLENQVANADPNADPNVDPDADPDAKPEEKLSFMEKMKKKFSKEKEKQEIYVRNVNFSVAQGELALIIGGVGSGKSSICQALLNEMEKVEGNVSLSGKVAYVSQSPWIQNLTVKDNILFGAKYDEAKFKHVLDICCLKHDLTTFPKGYNTLVGENGVTVSGGQKARIALARAVYQDADVYILDDSLSAVDPGIGASIFKNVISGYLKHKTRLFVTHQIPFCQEADKIIIMNNREVTESGTFDELKDHGYLQTMLAQVTAKEEEEEEKEEEKIIDKKPTEEIVDHANDDNLMTDEELARGNISLLVVMRYMWAAGGPLLIPMMISFVMAELCLAAPSLWLRFFVDNKFDLTTNQYLLIYCLLGAAGPVFIFLRDGLYHIHTAWAAERIHSTVVKRIMRAPMSFFWQTPLGRIMSRFSTDQNALDHTLVESMKFFMSSLIGLFVAFGIGIYATYWYSIAVVFCIVMYTIIGEMFRRNARELKRLENTARSPLFAQFSESVSGSSTIRAYGKEESFIREFHKKNNYLCRVEFLNSYLQAWASIHLDILSTVVTVGCFLLAVWTRGNSDASSIGLAITYSLSAPFLFQAILEQAANSEREFSSVERMLYYSTKVPVEPSAKGCKKPPKNWPETGEVEFQDFSMRYRESLPLVLKNVSFKIQGGERVGVVGRSGSGKSSIIQSLFRIVESANGRIVIDGEDLSDLSLFNVRSAMTIIPQSPTIFSGTIRSNLDPFHQHKDKDIIEALKKAYLWDYVDSLDAKLDSAVDEDGANMSAGQRQLICLARALLNNAQILVLDEVTSSVDAQSDAQIQEVVSRIKRNGKRPTTITIAHRLNTIITYDKILVMADGRVGEFGSPKELLQDTEGMFYGMVQDMGPRAAAKLIEIAMKGPQSESDDAPEEDDDLKKPTEKKMTSHLLQSMDQLDEMDGEVLKESPVEEEGEGEAQPDPNLQDIEMEPINPPAPQDETDAVVVDDVDPSDDQ